MDAEEKEELPTLGLTESSSEIVTEDEEYKIIIHITGEVINEGVIKINEGDRISDQTTPNMIQRISGVFERKPLISRGL